MQRELPIVRLFEVRRRLPASAVFSGRTAAWLHGLDMQACEPVEVTLPRACCISRMKGVSLKRSDVPDSEATTVFDLPVTSAVRTMADLGRGLPEIEAVVALDMALHRRITRAHELVCWAARHRRYRGSSRLVRRLDLVDPASESPMETRLRLLLVLHGLPRPLLQAALYDPSGLFIARTDLYYPRRRLAIEYDGGTHRRSMAGDNRRQNRLLEAGYRLLRFTAGDIINTPAGVVAQVRRALS